jgi:hypothetical protein
MQLDILQERLCNGCSACCTTHAVTEIEKPGYTVCSLLCEKGCSIYGDHPASCKGYKCLWRMGHLGEEHKPDKFGLVFSFILVDVKYCLTVHEVWDDAIEGEEQKELLHAIARQIPLYIIRRGGGRKLLGMWDMNLVKELIGDDRPELTEKVLEEFKRQVSLQLNNQEPEGWKL